MTAPMFEERHWLLIHHFLSIRFSTIKRKKKQTEKQETEVLSGHLFGSALWWVEKPTTAQK